MKGNPVFPFERNRYYSGKMLTSADFATEQQYVNHKRRFLNNLMFGSGIVCGCRADRIDETTIFVESGLAIDGQGREILIDAPVVKKLSAITGFEDTQSCRLALCLRYKEEKVQPVYSINRTDSETEYEYNRIREGYELFLRDAETFKSSKEKENTLLTSAVLYHGEDYEIKLLLPHTACRNHSLKLCLMVQKLSDGETEISFEGSLQMPAFMTFDEKQELDLNLQPVYLNKGESLRQEYCVQVQDTVVQETMLILKDGVVKSNGREKKIQKETSVNIVISNENPRELVNQELGRKNLETVLKETQEEEICLAYICLCRTGDAYIIEKAEDNSEKRYIETPAQNSKRNEYIDWFSQKQFSLLPQAKENQKGVLSHRGTYEENKTRIATGVLEIPIGGKAKPGEVFYSGEIMHGLGNGDVYVELGQEYLEEDGIEGANVRSTVFGNSRLFASAYDLTPKTEKAVKVLNDKGSFIAAVSFTEETECLMLTYRWAAFKFAENETAQKESNAEKQWIEAQTPTAVLAPGESFYCGVIFHEMERCGITYQITEKDGGNISLDGIYTAPNKEGVYEIMISCVEHPYISTYAYAIVKKK